MLCGGHFRDDCLPAAYPPSLLKLREISHFLSGVKVLRFRGIKQEESCQEVGIFEA